MSSSWKVEFRRKPDLRDLDEFMKSLEFTIEEPGKRSGEFTRVYNFFNKSVAPRVIDFFYEDKVCGKRCFTDYNEGKRVRASGDVTTYSTLAALASLKKDEKPSWLPVLGEAKRLRIIRGKNIRRQQDYYKHLDKDRLKFYETALAIRDRFNAVVVWEDGGEIDPDKFPFMSNPFKE